MVNFLEYLDTFKKRLLDKEVVLFLDYDGTLAPIADMPYQAVLPQEMRKALTVLSQLPQCKLNIISGRALIDLKKMINIPNMTYVGNHGFEMEGFYLSPENLIPVQYDEDIKIIKEQLKEGLLKIKGAWIEDKGIILTVHFRLAQDKDTALVKRTFLKVCQNYIQGQRIHITKGKKVLEIRPAVNWGKGDAAAWLLGKWQRELGKGRFIAMYIGDDQTDEDAFKMLGNRAITIKVGSHRNSAAQYHLKDYRQVLELLQQICVEKGLEKNT